MTKLLATTTLLLTLLVSPIWAETLSMDDLVKRDGLYYKKFTDVPFTGEVFGKKKGSLKSGKKNGKWTTYYENGQLQSREHFKDGKYTGLWETFLKNGNTLAKGNYKNGDRIGLWTSYWQDGATIRNTTHYKLGKPYGVSEQFWSNGNIWKKIYFAEKGRMYKREFFDKNTNGLRTDIQSCGGFPFFKCKSVIKRSAKD